MTQEPAGDSSKAGPPGIHGESASPLGVLNLTADAAELDPVCLCGLAQRSHDLGPRSLGFPALLPPGPLAGTEDLCPMQSDSDTGLGYLCLSFCADGPNVPGINDQIDAPRKGVLTSKCHQPRRLSRHHLVKAPCKQEVRPRPFLLQDPIFRFLCLLDVFIVEDI